MGTFAALASGFAVLCLKIDSLVKSAVETFGPSFTGTAVTVDKVRLSPLSGKGRIQGLRIGNPKGFSPDDAFRVQSLSVSLKPRSLFSDQIVIRDVTVRNPEISFEKNSSGSNIDAIRRHAQAPASTPDSEKGGKKVLVENFLLTGGKIKLRAQLFKGKALELPLPDLHLKDIGKKPGGATAKEATAQVLSQITNSVLKAVTSAGSKALSNTLQDLKGLFKKR